MRRALLLAVAALLFVLAVVPVAASPAPTSVCPVCDYELESVAGSNGVDLTVAESEATVRIHENGTTTWTARVRAENASSFQQLEADPGLREAVEDAFGFGGPETEVRTVRLDDGTLVVRYARFDQVTRSQGVVRYDGLREGDGYAYLGLGADRITVEGLPNTTLVRAPGAASVEGDRVTYTALPGDEGTFLVFAPEGVSAPGVRATLAVFLPLLPVFARNAAWFIGLPLVLVGGGLTGLRYGLDGRSLDCDLVARGVGALAVGVGLVVAVDVALGPGTRVPFSPGAQPAAIAGTVATLLLAGYVARGTTPTLPRAVGITAGAAFVGTVVAVGLTALLGEAAPVEGWVMGQLLFPLPVLLAFPVGVAARSTTRAWRVTLLGALLPAIVLLAVQFDVFETDTYDISLLSVFVVLVAVTATLVSLPLFLLGWTAAGPQSFRSSA